MKLLYIILDGLGDRPCKQLENKSPLEFAYTPNLDFLAREGRTGLLVPIAKNIAPESDEAMLALLGFDPFKYHRGRGPLEAFGAGVHFNKGELILRANFAVERQGLISDIEAQISESDAKKYAKAISKELSEIEGVQLRLVHTVGYRAVLILRGKGLSPKISNTHPGYAIVRGFVTSAQPISGRKLRLLKCKPLVRSAAAAKTAHIINKFTERVREILHDKKANIVLLRGAGLKLPSLHKLSGRWALLADMPVEKAIGKLTGMQILQKPRNLKKLANVVLQNLSRFGHFYFEIKGPDHFGHRGDPLGKAGSISKIDKLFFGRLLSKLNFDKTIICVTGDHSTPCAIRAHSADPVPLLIYSPHAKPDKVNIFSERACKSGALKLVRGVRLLHMLK